MSFRAMEPQDDVREGIARVRRRWVLQARLSAAGPWMVCTAAALALAVLVVRVANVDGLALVLLMAAGTILALTAVCAAVVRMRRAPADRQVARFIEERVESLTGDQSWSDGIVSAVEIAQSGGERRAAFDHLVLAEAANRLRSVDPRRLITTRSMRAAVWSTVAGGVCLVLASAASAPSVLRAVDIARVTFFPGTIHLDVSPGSIRVPAGAPVRVRTYVRGGNARAVTIPPVVTVVTADGTRTVAMAPSGDAFEWALPSVERTFAYRVSAGATRSADFTVTAVFPPSVTRIDVSYTYPSFAGLGPREEQDGGDIYAPAGTRIRLRIHTDRPVTRGELTLASGRAVAARPAPQDIVEADVIEADLVVTKDDSYRVTLTDAEGLQSRNAVEYFIRPMDDRPPTVRIARPSSDHQISPLEEIAIEARADDDYGIAAFDMVYAVSGGGERTVPFTRVSGTEVARVGTRVLSAEELGLRPGDVISYYARARDIGRGKRSTRSTSDIYFLEVKPFSEEFAGSASQATGQGGAQIDSLVDAQKQIIASTWNIERRSPAGRSPGALKAVAEAQALLRTRAEQMAARSIRRPGRMLVPQSAAGALQQGTASDPLASAVQAMGKAMEQLETDRTREALPHEMAALNGLLQAQAEVRRREIARQQATAGANGGNRSGQDLSALFDKELQRQQQTNYETRKAPEAPASPAPDAALLDRIRDLARRQEDLSRRHAEAAGKIDDSEARRQLEKLTREQTQLRQEAQDLARRLDGGRAESPRPQNGETPRSSSGEPSGRSTSKEDGASMEAAAQEMGAAANDLRRDDAAGAARSGARAAEQLRRFEERARGRSEEAGGARTVEQQLEARQIAREQRRIASETQRLDQDTETARVDGRKRLAAEKSRLAERVEALGRGIARTGEGTQPPRSTGVPPGELTQELGAIARRMRESAAGMRDDKTGSSRAAPGEQELARAMERVAGRIGGGASDETAQLSQQLEQADAIRDRLNRLDAQVRALNPREGSTKASRGETQRGADDVAGRPEPGEKSEAPRQNAPVPAEFWRELAETRKMLEQLTTAQPATGSGKRVAPEQDQFSRSAPGTEAFKQDRTAWESLRRDLGLSLEQHEVALSSRLVRKPSGDRLSAGGSEQAPDGYDELIAKYFESLASMKKAKQ